MSAVTFFGASIDAVRDARRRRDYCADTEGQLEQRLRELRSRRDRQFSQNSSQVQQQAEKIPVADANLERARKSLGDLLGQYHRLARIDGSFWIKLGLRVAKLVWRKALRVSEIKGRLAAMEQQLDDAEANVDYLVLVRAKQQRALQHLTGPIEELDRVIESLQRQLDEASRERADCDKAILDAVREVVRLTAADSLGAKLTGFSARTNVGTLAERVYRLRSLMLELETIDRGEEGELAEADQHHAEQRIREAAEHAFGQQSSHGISQMRMTGRGTTHVRKTRTRMETVRDSSGHMKTRPRTEHYWDTAPVTFSGELPVSFEIIFRRWTPDTVATVLCDETKTSFALGVQQFRKTVWQKREDDLIRQADTCNREIRDMLLDELD